jgi:hypothetical protein
LIGGAGEVIDFGSQLVQDSYDLGEFGNKGFEKLKDPKPETETSITLKGKRIKISEDLALVEGSLLASISYKVSTKIELPILTLYAPQFPFLQIGAKLEFAPSATGSLSVVTMSKAGH